MNKRVSKDCYNFIKESVSEELPGTHFLNIHSMVCMYVHTYSTLNHVLWFVLFQNTSTTQPILYTAMVHMVHVPGVVGKTTEVIW